jgi:5'-nucleotidase
LARIAPSDRFPRYEPTRPSPPWSRRYAPKAGPLAGRVVGRMTGPAKREKTASREQVLGDLIADAHLAATRRAGAQIAFTNGRGPDRHRARRPAARSPSARSSRCSRSATSLVVKSFTGRQIKALLEQQFDSGSNTVASPNMLLPSANCASPTICPARRAADRRAHALDGTPIPTKRSTGWR